MSPDRTSRLVRRWVRLYTRGLPEDVARRRIDEIDADLHDHVAHERATGTSGRAIALRVLSRMLRGVAADASWRDAQVHANLGHPATRAAAIRTRKVAYRSALGLTVWTVFVLFWLIGAVGVIGESGDRADMLYLVVFGVVVLGALVARLRAHGMARVLATAAVATAVIATIAIGTGEHESPVTSIGEILGLNAGFAAMFAGSAWLFHQAGRYRDAVG